VKLALVRCEQQNANWSDFAIAGTHSALCDIAAALRLERNVYCDLLSEQPAQLAEILGTDQE